MNLSYSFHIQPILLLDFSLISSVGTFGKPEHATYNKTPLVFLLLLFSMGNISKFMMFHSWITQQKHTVQDTLGTTGATDDFITIPKDEWDDHKTSMAYLRNKIERMEMLMERLISNQKSYMDFVHSVKQREQRELNWNIRGFATKKAPATPFVSASSHTSLE